MRVLLLHNRYRLEGGEERSVELQLRAMEHAGVEHRLFERRSAEVGRGRAAAAMLRGGAKGEIANAVRELGADIAHAHNMQPLIGPRGLAAAREAGAHVVLHLHNARLFCAIGVAARDGGPCFRCRGRNTVPGLVLNCRASLPEAAVYAAALAAHQPLVFDAVDRFATPSRWAAGQLAQLGVPADRLDVLPHYLPAAELAPTSLAGEGGYALAASRLSPEKGLGTAIEAAALAGVPLRIAGDGPQAAELAGLARRLGAPVEMLGPVARSGMAELLAGAAMLVLSSHYHEFSPFSVLEAMGAGVPVVATRTGGVPELIGRNRCVPMGDAPALAERMRALWEQPGLRRDQGEALLARTRERHSEERYVRELLELYERARRQPRTREEALAMRGARAIGKPPADMPPRPGT
jgi:glycosyltransferase involved in cell wall biosynthesis